MTLRLFASLLLLLAVWIGLLVWSPAESEPLADGREEVVFWHFWGGQDGEVVQRIVDRFNARQDRYFVRAVAMPGNNLDLKLFASVTGGDPPDLINHDDPIVADWARRGALTPLDELAPPEEIEQLQSWLFPAARKLGSYENRLYALCNGLDVRALYYNQTMLQQYDLPPPETLADLDRIAETIAPPSLSGPRERYGYLPDSRRLWAWGVVFGGRFHDPQTGEITLDEPPIAEALQWMQGYSRRYGIRETLAFRAGDQSLPGKTFPLLAERYAVVMDGQWRVRDIAAFQQQQRETGLPVTEYGVCPLPPPPGGRANAGWVNGNFFLVPRGADQAAGAWEFMKFWSGFDGNEPQAARICGEGGWIPASEKVVREAAFQESLAQRPLMRKFIDLAASPAQIPTPAIPGAPFYYQEVQNVSAACLYREDAAVQETLKRAAQRVRRRLQRLENSKP